MEIKSQLPFNVSCEEGSMTSYSSRHELDDALEMYNCNQPGLLDNESLEAVADYLSAYADYVNGVWEGTDIPLNIDTIDGDDFVGILIKADSNNL